MTGTSFAVATKEGRIGLAIPEDERDLAERGWADEIRTFQPASLDKIVHLSDAVRDALGGIAESLGLQEGCVIGYQREPLFVPVTYASINIYGVSIRDILNAAVQSAILRPANGMLSRLRSRLTQRELDCVRRACRIAQEAFERGARQIKSGMAEFDVANLFRGTLFECTGEERHGGYAFCMSGPNSALAKAAYQLTRPRRLEPGDFALVHCNSYVEGFWTDITRTFSIGAPDERKISLYSAVLEASEAALSAVCPGAKASEIDRRARDVMRSRGFGEAFSHPAGHGVGFAAIDHDALPRIHPKSDETLEPGMVFNIEPAAYFEGEGGIRHCNMIAVTETGAELLTPFFSKLDDLVVPVQA